MRRIQEGMAVGALGEDTPIVTENHGQDTTAGLNEAYWCHYTFKHKDEVVPASDPTAALWLHTTIDC